MPPKAKRCIIDSVIATSCYYHATRQRGDAIANKLMDDALVEFLWLAEVSSIDEVKEIISILESEFSGHMEDRPLIEILDMFRGHLSLRELGSE